MSHIVNCPSCNRKLRVPDELVGKRVKCPTCDKTFTASADMVTPEAPPALAEAGEAPASTGSEPEAAAPKQAPRLRTEEEEAAFESSQEYDDAARPHRRRRRPDMQPHRGVLILILGILSIVICGFLGPFAWIMGSYDLREIRAGRMDPDGEGTTQAGRILGIISTVIMLLFICGATLAVPLVLLGRAAHQGF